LSGAEMAVGLFGVVQIFVEGFHFSVSWRSSVVSQISGLSPQT